MTFWQISAGDDGRSYSNYFFKYGIAFVGGDSQKETIKELKEGDIVVLKEGISKILAAGIVEARNGIINGIGNKKWLDDFDGWELDGWCYIKWYKKEIKVKGLTRGTIKRCNSKNIKTLALEILKGQPVEICSEPDEPVPLDDTTLINFLIKSGLRVGQSEEFSRSLRYIRQLASYYYYNGWSTTKEHETRTFLVIPFLISLGWSEQQMKIEYPTNNRGKIDIALFDKPYHSEYKECVAIIETKDFKLGLDYAHHQAVKYAKDFEKCNTLVVSNGRCYKTFNKDITTNEFNKLPSGYLNILKPTRRYPVDPNLIDGALSVIESLLPKRIT